MDREAQKGAAAKQKKTFLDLISISMRDTVIDSGHTLIYNHAMEISSW